MRSSTGNEADTTTTPPLLGEQINVEQMPPPTRIVREGAVAAMIWGTVDPDPGEQIRQAGRSPLSQLAAKVHASTSGVYFLLLRNENSRECAFFVDLFSCKKVFYHQREGVVYFSTNLGRLVRNRVVRPVVDVATVATFLMYDYVPTNHTLLENVRSVRPFTVYHLRGGVLSSSDSWPFEKASRSVGHREAVQGTFERLESAFLSGSSGFDSLIVPLSGGRDSRLLLGLALKHQQRRISTLTFGQPGTLDFEIGKGLARKLGLDQKVYVIGEDFYQNHVVPSTPYVNGLINHFLAPSNFLSGQFRSSVGQAVLSGYIGDLVLGPKKGSIPVLCRKGVRYPAPKQLTLDAALEMLPSAREPLMERLAELQKGLDMCCSDDAIPMDDWFYRIRVTTFTSVGLFSEKDEGFCFLTPFVNLDCLRWMFSLPDDIKASPSFYRDVVASDGGIASLFKFPLKNLNGAGYSRGRSANILSTAHYGWKAWRSGVRPKQNYANYEKMYPDAFVLDQALAGFSLRDLLGIDPGLPLQKLTYAQKALLLSIRLHLDCIFEKGAQVA